MQPLPSRYKLGRVIGRGGYAVVYEATDLKLNMPVALKVLLDDTRDEVAIARFAREGRAARMINHPNVCATYDCGVLDDSRRYVAMELLAGETLRAYLGRKGQLEVEDAIEIAVQMLAGLEDAHAKGVVHRDVKPENVFLCGEDPRTRLVKLLDFGICRRLADPVDDCTLTNAGCVVGTPGYLAPEQAYGERSADARVDIFSVGLIVYEALVGRPVHEGKNTAQLEVAFSRPLPALGNLRAVPHVLERVIAKATEPLAAHRYATAGQFLHDLLETRTIIRQASQTKGPSHAKGPPSLRSQPAPRYNFADDDTTPLSA